MCAVRRKPGSHRAARLALPQIAQRHHYQREDTSPSWDTLNAQGCLLQCGQVRSKYALVERQSPHETRCATRVGATFGDEWVSPQREVMSAGGASEQLRSTPSHNLPAARSSFVGRERELREVQRELETTRLLTLTGVGGSGKTRLALEVARDLVQDTRRPSAGSRRASPPQKSWAIGGTSPTSWRARASSPVRGARRAGRRDFWVPRRL